MTIIRQSTGTVISADVTLSPGQRRILTAIRALEAAGRPVNYANVRCQCSCGVAYAKARMMELAALGFTWEAEAKAASERPVTEPALHGPQPKRPTVDLPAAIRAAQQARAERVQQRYGGPANPVDVAGPGHTTAAEACRAMREEWRKRR